MKRLRYGEQAPALAALLAIAFLLGTSGLTTEADAQGGGYVCGCQSTVYSQLADFGQLECQHGPQGDPDDCPPNGMNGDNSDACDETGGAVKPADDPDPMKGDGVCTCYDCNTGLSGPGEDPNCEALFEYRMAECPDPVTGTCPAGNPVQNNRYPTTLSQFCTSCTNNGQHVTTNTPASCSAPGGSGASGACLTNCCTPDMANPQNIGNGTECP